MSFVFITDQGSAVIVDGGGPEDMPHLRKILQQDLVIDVDELQIAFLFCREERYLYPKPNLAVNEASIAFKVTAPGMRSVLFLGDLGPEGGSDLLLWWKTRA